MLHRNTKNRKNAISVIERVDRTPARQVIANFGLSECLDQVSKGLAYFDWQTNWFDLVVKDIKKIIERAYKDLCDFSGKVLIEFVENFQKYKVFISTNHFPN